MEKYLIESRGEGRSSTYSFFEIPDQKLKQKILDFKIDETEFTEYSMSDKGVWKILEQDGDEFKCQRGRDIKYFSKEYVEDALERKKLIELNLAFPICKHFKRMFGIISNNSHGSLERLDFRKKESPAFDGRHPSGVDAFFYEYTYQTSKHYDESLSLNFSKHGSLMSMYFTAEGTIANRDYNCRLQDFILGDIHPNVILKKFEANVLSLNLISFKTLKDGDLVFFNDSNAFIVSFDKEDCELELSVCRKNSSGFVSGWTRFTNKKAQSCSPEQVIGMLMEKFPQLFKHFA